MSGKSKLVLTILAGVVVVLVVLATLAPKSSPGKNGSIYSTERAGLAALYKWLGEIGYKPQSMEYRDWAFKPEDQALIISQPTGLTAEDVDTLLSWIETSGATVLVIDNSNNSLFSRLSLTVNATFTVLNQSTTVRSLPLREPLANPEVGTVYALTENDATVFQTNRRDGTVLVGSEDAPILVGYTYGAGQLYVVSDLLLISNVGLKYPENARLVLNLLSRLPAGSTVLFDEIHHDRALIKNVQQTINKPLVTSIIYLALVMAVWGLWNGRRFGTLLPASSDQLQRSSAEYVQSMAGLFQRAQQRGFVLHHYRLRFKRRLARPNGFSPGLEDQAFIRELARYQAFDEQHLAALLARLGAVNPSATDLLQLVAATDEFVRELENGR